MNIKEDVTGTLFGNLFTAYDMDSYQHSIELFAKRFQENGFPLEWFRGKRCLDVGCGGGRYSLALAMLGAEHCIGIDISKASIADAQVRAEKLGVDNVDFRVVSATSLPFEDNSFDFVVFSGVLMHLANPVTTLGELGRVVAPQGILYLLVYATEGLRWPLIQMLRPLAQAIGFDNMDRAVAEAGLAVNRRRTYLDDLFVPYIDFYSWQCLENLLLDKGFSNIERWRKGRLDHEESLTAYRKDLQGLYDLFKAMAGSSDAQLGDYKPLLHKGEGMCRSVLEYVDDTMELVQKGMVSEEKGRELIMGQGHHRVLARKG